MAKEGKVKGEVTTISYKKGEKLPGFEPLDEGTYSFTLKNAGKPYPKGWKVKPGKYPNRKIVWEALDTEDEKSGSNKTCNEYISLSPGSLPIGPIRLAYAAQFDITLKQGPKGKPNHPSVKENAQAIDRMLQHIKKEELTLRGDVTHEEFNGQKMARIRWLPPEDLEESEAEADDDEEVDEDEETVEEETDEDESDDSNADESDDDDESEASSDEDGDEDADDDSDEDSDADDDADEDDEDDDADDDIDDEAVEEHKKKPKAGAKVKQGPTKAGKKAVPVKKVVTKKKGKK